MAGKDVSDAASRIRGLLGEEDRRRRRIGGMMDRLRTYGWSIPKPARPVQGPTVGDAAQAFEVRLDAADALRDEAERQVAAATEASDTGPADNPNALDFKRDNSIADWRWAVPAMAEHVGLEGESKDLALHADSDIVPILAGIHAYRHLDPRSQENVLGLINKMATNGYRPDLWPLAGRLQEHVAAAKASPYQSLWSMSDREIGDHIRRQEDFLNMLDSAGDVQDIGELGLAGAGAANIARSVAIPGAVANGVLLAAKHATKANKAHLESALEERRNGGNPFDRLPAVNP